MPNALTLETMSPRFLRVGETRSPEPHQRKSRMREIRSSGSGEGPGWVTARPTLPSPFGATPQAAPARRRGLQPGDARGRWSGLDRYRCWGAGGAFRGDSTRSTG